MSRHFFNRVQSAGPVALFLLTALPGTGLPLVGVDTAQAEFRVAFVDMQRALQASEAGKEAQKKYDIEVKKSQSKIDEKKADFERLQKSYSKQKDSLNEKARGDREEELGSVEKELRRSFQDTKENLQRRNGQIVGELVNELRKVVEEVGQDEGYTLILEKGSPLLLYGDSKIEITEEVIKRFDAKH